MESVTLGQSRSKWRQNEDLDRKRGESLRCARGGLNQQVSESHHDVTDPASPPISPPSTQQTLDI